MYSQTVYIFLFVVIAALVVFIIYYLLLMLGETLGRKGFSPGLSMWAPNIIWGTVGILLVGKESRR